MPLFIIYLVLFILILLSSGVIFIRKKKHGFWAYFLLGWSLQILLSLPAGIWQAINLWPHIASSSPLYKRLFTTPVMGWFFNAGGFTVRYVFEATVGPLEWLVGHRSATVMSNMPYYAFLLLVQGSILSILFAWRCKKQKVYDDWFAVCIGVLFLVNSFLNVSWFWAGT